MVVTRDAGGRGVRPTERTGRRSAAERCESFRWYCYLVEGPNGDVYGWNNPLRAPPPASDPPSPIRYWRRDKKSACFVPTPLPKGVNPS